MKSPIAKVRKNTGMNPVARAVAKTRFASAMLEMRINLFMLEEGEHTPLDFATLDIVVNALMRGMQDDANTPDFRKLKSAQLLIIRRMNEGYIYHQADTVTLDNALDIAIKQWPKLSPAMANAAINFATGTSK